MIKRILHAVTLTAAFPFLVSVVAYYGFATNYTEFVFHESGFRQQYQSGIYKYRILGTYLLLRTDRLIKSHSAPAHLIRRALARVPTAVRALDKQCDAPFYAAYFLQNTFFMIVACVILFFLLGRGKSEPTMLAGLLMGLTQYVVCPYDTLSYALLLLTFLLITRPFRFSFPLLVLTTVLGALTRESAVLTLSFYFAVHHANLLKLRRKETCQLAILVGAFVVTYAALRLCLGLDSQSLWQRETLNIRSPFNWVGILALPVVSYLLCVGSRNLRSCRLFLAAGAPYIIIVPLVAIWWEIRLWVPVWLGLICLAKSIPADSAQAPSRPHEQAAADR